MKNGSMVRDQFERRRPVLIALIATVLLAGVVVAAGQRGDDEERAIGGEVAGPTGARTDGETPPSSNSDSGALDGVLADGTSTNNAPAPGGGGSVPGVQPEPGTGPEGAAVSSGPLPVGADVHGVTDTAIQIGLITSDIGSVRALGPVFGTGDGGSDPTGDYDKANAAAVDLVNSMGGIAGRKVEPVYYFYNPSAIATASGRQQENQAACARWTEDNHVFAMWGGATTDESLMQCAVDTKTPMLLMRYGIQPSASRFASMAEYWYAPSFFVAERRERALVKFLHAKSFFGNGAKVGLMVEDQPDTREGVDKGMKPALAAAGIEPEVEIAYPDPIESNWQNYVLQLQAAGVTHVVWAHPSIGTLEALLAMRAAEDQQYRPKWGLATDHFLQSLADAGAPPEQLVNVVGMGSKPSYDLADYSAQSEHGRLCIEQLSKYAPGEEDNLYAWDVCELLLFLRAAFEKADIVSPAGLVEGVGRLGASYGSTTTIGGATKFGPGRHDGTSVVRAVTYDAATNRMQYTTEPQPVPE